MTPKFIKSGEQVSNIELITITTISYNTCTCKHHCS